MVLAKHAGLGGAPSVPRGGVNTPSSPTNRLAALSADLGMERAARERAERNLNQALAMVRDLQTKLAHAELAKNEALAATRTEHEAIASLRVAHRERAEQAVADLAAERAARTAAEASLQTALAAVDAAERLQREQAAELPPKRAAKTAAPRDPVAKKPKAPRAVREPKPVRWWIRSEGSAKR